MANGKKSRFSVRNSVSMVLLVSGLLLILVPIIKTYSNTKRNDDLINEFLKQSEQAASDIDSMTREDVEDFYIPPELPNSDIGAGTENTPLPSESTEPTESPVASPEPTKKSGMSKEEIQKRMTGVLLIPKIDVKMLIMDGTDDDTLRVAAGRLTYTGNFDEIGNCVLAGHRSYTFGKYLNRLNELEIGDTITVQTKDKTLNYTIYKSHIIEPDDFSILNKNDTDKILTVFTCHPPGIGNKRLVVHAKQVE